jgi:hypothetical protein
MTAFYINNNNKFLFITRAIIQWQHGQKHSLGGELIDKIIIIVHKRQEDDSNKWQSRKNSHHSQEAANARGKKTTQHTA